MLPDLQRKLLRILYNFSSQQRRMPNWGELERKTGRRRPELSAALEQLKEKGFITWEEASPASAYLPGGEAAAGGFDPQQIVMLQSREPEERLADPRFSFQEGKEEERTRYWTQY